MKFKSIQKYPKIMYIISNISKATLYLSIKYINFHKKFKNNLLTYNHNLFKKNPESFIFIFSTKTVIKASSSSGNTFSCILNLAY